MNAIDRETLNADWPDRLSPRGRHRGTEEALHSVAARSHAGQGYEHAGDAERVARTKERRHA